MLQISFWNEDLFFWNTPRGSTLWIDASLESVEHETLSYFLYVYHSCRISRSSKIISGHHKDDRSNNPQNGDREHQFYEGEGFGEGEGGKRNGSIPQRICCASPLRDTVLGERNCMILLDNDTVLGKRNVLGFL